MKLDKLTNWKVGRDYMWTSEGDGLETGHGREILKRRESGCHWRGRGHLHGTKEDP